MQEKYEKNCWIGVFEQYIGGKIGFREEIGLFIYRIGKERIQGYRYRKEWILWEFVNVFF